MDITWLKDKSLADLDNLPDPGCTGVGYFGESGGGVGEFQGNYCIVECEEVNLVYMSYGVVAVNAAKDAVRGKLSPASTWKDAVCKEYPDSKESQKKSCPKSAFLGLCSNGDIQNIRGGNYAKPGLNAIYAIKAAEILKSGRTSTFTFNYGGQFYMPAVLM